MPMTFCLATYADHLALGQLHAQSWQVAYRGLYTDAYLAGPVLPDRQAVWEARLSKPAPNQWVCLAEDAEGLAGFVCAYLHEDARYGTLVDNLHAAPHRRGQGLGTQLLARAAAWAQAHGSSGLYLWVYEANLPARRFYDHLGAVHQETEGKSNPDGGELPTCRYVWPNSEDLARRAIGLV